MHDLPLINTIAASFTAAWLLGLLTQKLKLSPIVGYLIAGVLIGPHTPGFAGDVKIAIQLSEVGIILLMFGVGLHFHLKDLLAVKGVAIPGAIGQSVVATLVGLAAFSSPAIGLSMQTGALLGMAMAVASTVVLMRVLMDAGTFSSAPGHVAVGWLLVEDVLTIVILVLIPVMGHGSGNTSESTQIVAGAAHFLAGLDMAAPTSLWLELGKAFLKLGLLITIVMVAGGRIVPWVLVRVAQLRSRELFTLTVLVFSIAIAAASYKFFGVSMALGAFLAGMVVAQSPVSHQAAADALPMRDAFAVLFFVSVGMLFDPACITENPLMILAALGIILIAKPLAALVIVATLGHSARTALTVAVGLAQIGEFSFILSDAAREHKLLNNDDHNILVAAAIISITLNPLLFRNLDKIEAWVRRHPWLWNLLNARAERRTKQINAGAAEQLSERNADSSRLAIVIGFGPVGRSVHRLLEEAGLDTIVIDLNMDTVSELESQGKKAIFGDASHESILEQAGVRDASHLVLTLPHSTDRAMVIAKARNFNSKLRILVRARYLSERETLEQVGATAAVFEEAEAAVALARLVLADTGANREMVERTVRDLRLQLILENVSNLHGQRVRNVMVPWTQVQRISLMSNFADVMAQSRKQHFSRLPVVRSENGRPVGYLLVKDLIANATPPEDWTKLIRPLRAVQSDADIESTLIQMQSEGMTMCVVEAGESPVGLITLEDILEQVVGRIEDEYPRDSSVLLLEAIQNGSVILELSGRTVENVIRELAAAISPSHLPPECNVAEIALAREDQVSTDLGSGIAIPHARCRNLKSPIVVVGRSNEGVLFSNQSSELVRLVFLLVTPLEKPALQLFLLSQLAKIAGKSDARTAMLETNSTEEVVEILTRDRGTESSLSN